LKGVSNQMQWREFSDTLYQLI